MCTYRDRLKKNGCVKRAPVARVGRDAGITQPRDPALADPCTYRRLASVRPVVFAKMSCIFLGNVRISRGSEPKARRRDCEHVAKLARKSHSSALLKAWARAPDLLANCCLAGLSCEVRLSLQIFWFSIYTTKRICGSKYGHIRMRNLV